MFGDFLDYKDGDLYWKVSRGRVKAGSLAGTLTTTEWGHTYRLVRVNKVSYLAHRIIWELHHGEIEEGMVIDHINGDTLDNRLENLRVCTNTQNAQNIHAGRGIYSKLKGVSFHKKQKKWVAQININGKANWIGSFESQESAHQAYLNEANKHFGEFANGGVQSNEI